MDEWRKRLQDRIASLGLTPREVTRRASVNPTMVHDILNKGSIPSAENLMRIAQVLGMTLTELYEGTERVHFSLKIDGVTTSSGMWAQIPSKHAKVLPLEIFSQDTVAVEISNDDYAPRFDRGDVVTGPRFRGDSLHNILGMDCIIQTTDGERRLAILLQGAKPKHYTLRSLNPRLSDIQNASVEWAAPIRMILRGQS